MSGRLTCQQKQVVCCVKLNILKVDWVEDKVALITDVPMSQEQVVCLAQEGGEYPSVIRGGKGGGTAVCVENL